MNKKLNNDWSLGIGFFKNSILYSEMEYTQDMHIDLLGLIWSYLDLKIESNESIFFLNDWHNHDGYVSKEKQIGKKELEMILTDPNKIFTKRDFYVYDLVYDMSEKFMLRWYCQDEGGNEIYCDFSLILSNDKELKDIEKVIRKNILGEGLKIKNAKLFFDERYGG